MGIAIGVLSAAMQFWQPTQGYAEGYFLDNQCCYNQSYFFRPFLNYLVFDGGYRWDRVSEFVETFGGDPFTAGSESLRYENISSAQFGAKGALSFGNFYIRGRGHYGVLTDGIYNIQVTIAEVRGYTWDAAGAVGYLLSCNDCLGMAPVVGYSYDKLRFQLVNLVSDSINLIPGVGPANKNHHQKEDIRFYGPLIGIDFFFSSCNWAFTAGYEYIFGRIKDRIFNIADNAVLASEFLGPDHFRSRNARGQSFRLDGLYALSCGWTWGFGLKYSIWDQRTRTTLTEGTNLEEFDGNPNNYEADTHWHSVIATFNVGYTF